MKKIILVLLIGLFTLVSAFAGGGGQPQAPTSQTNWIEMDRAAVTGTVTYWSWMPRPGTQFPSLLEAWQRRFPNLTLDYGRLIKVDHLVRLRTSMLGGDGPDVFAVNLGSNARPYVDQVVPLRQFAERSWGPNWERRFLPLSTEWARQYGDDYPFMPVSLIAAPMIVYDAELLEQVGAQPPTTYQELIDVLALFRNVPGILPHVGAGLREEDKANTVFFTLIEQIQPGAFLAASEGQRAWTEPVFIQALNRFKQLFDDGLFPSNALTVALYPEITYDSFITEARYPMIFAGSFFMGELVPQSKEARDIMSRRFGIIPFPNLEGGDPVILTGVDQALAIPRTTQDPEKAWLFIEFMANEYQRVTNRLMEQFPAEAGVGLAAQTLTNPNEIQAAQNLTALITANASGNTTARNEIEYPELARAIYDGLINFVLRNTPAQTVLQEIERVSRSITR